MGKGFCFPLSGLRVLNEKAVWLTCVILLVLVWVNRTYQASLESIVSRE